MPASCLAARLIAGLAWCTVLAAAPLRAEAGSNLEGGFRCAMDGQTATLSCTPMTPIDPLRPRTRMLVIFIRYADENPHALSPCWTAWPVAGIPSWADSLIEPGTSPAAFHPGSLNHYFWTMSGGRHYVYGTYHPQVVTLDHGLGWYRDHATVADLCREVIQKVDPVVNFADYDVEPADGVVDMIAILSRSEIPWGWQGASYLGKDDIWTNDYRGPTRIMLDGCYPGSGTYQFAPNHIGALQTIAHEYMHQVFVPKSLVPGSPYAFPDDTWHLNYVASYGLMDGNGQATTMSAFERVWLGWSTPVTITTTTADVSLPDAASTGACVKVYVDPADTLEYFLIENRQRVYYSDLAHGDGGSTECCNNELESTGLMVYHIDERDLPGGFPGPSHHAVDVECADGMRDPATGLPDPVHGLDGLDGPEAPECRADTVRADAFGPGGGTSFSPFTNPSSKGYRWEEPFGPWAQDRDSGVTLQNIRFDPADPLHVRMLVDIIVSPMPPRRGL